MNNNLDKSGYGKLLRSLKDNFTSINEWKPVYAAQTESAKAMSPIAPITFDAAPPFA